MSTDFSRLKNGENLHIFINETFGLNQAVSRSLSCTIVNLIVLQEEVKQLEKTVRSYEKRPRCSGVAHYPVGAPHYGKRMYANHKKNCACPLHGEPKPGGRIRRYVREDDHELVKQAIENWQQWEAAQLELETVRARLKELETAVYRVGFGSVEIFEP